MLIYNNYFDRLFLRGGLAMELKGRLRELRGKITQIECANNIGVSPVNYSKWERGLTIPDYKTLIRIADYHKVSLDYLTGRVDYEDLSYRAACEQTGLTENAIKGIQQLQKDSTDNFNYIGMLNELLCLQGDIPDSEYTFEDILGYFLHPNGYLWSDEVAELNQPISTAPQQMEILNFLHDRIIKFDKIREIALHLYHERHKNDNYGTRECSIDILDEDDNFEESLECSCEFYVKETTNVPLEPSNIQLPEKTKS